MDNTVTKIYLFKNLLRNSSLLTDHFLSKQSHILFHILDIMIQHSLDIQPHIIDNQVSL